MTSDDPQVSIREKLDVLESKREQISRAVNLFVEQAKLIGEIPLQHDINDEEQCAPYIRLLNQHITVCSDLFDRINRTFGSISTEDTPRLIPCNESVQSDSSLAAPRGRADTLDTLGSLNSEELPSRIRDMVLQQLNTFSTDLRSTLLADISKLIAQQIAELRGQQPASSQPEPDVATTPRDPASASANQRRAEPTTETPTRGADLDEDQTEVKQLYVSADAARELTRSLTSSMRLEDTEHSIGDLTVSTSNEYTRSGGVARQRDRPAAAGRSKVLTVPTDVIGQGYPPEVIFHGKVTSSIDISGSVKLCWNKYYVLNKAWYHRPSGVFTIPATGPYRFHLDVSAQLCGADEKKRSTCQFRLCRPCAGRSPRGMEHFAKCDLTSLWWEDNIQSAQTDETVSLPEGTDIFLEAFTVNGIWSIVPSAVILMIVDTSL